MSQQSVQKAPSPATAPIVGYKAIAAAITKRLARSCCRRTAIRYAKQGRAMRLPVFRYPNRRVYLLPAHLEAWAIAWEAALPSGGVG